MSSTKKKTRGKPNDIDRYIAQRLNIRRRLMGLSQEKMGEALGVTFQQFQKYERCFNRISAGNLYKTARALKVSVGYFYEGYDEIHDEKAQIYPPDLLQNKETIELIRAYHAIKDKQVRRDFIRLMKRIEK